MVDIHSHVLPGIDDGSKDLETSLAMLQMAAEAGTTDIVATPHANPRYHFDPRQVEELIGRLESERGREFPRLHYGCDFHLSFDNLCAALEHPDRFTINHGRYLLVEFPDLAIFPNSGELLDRFLTRGLVPVITHPERNDWLRQRIGDLKAWVEMGCLLQLTAGSITGRFGGRAERFCRELFDEGLAHVVASDAHDTERRTPDMREARNRISRDFGEAAAAQAFETTPTAIIQNEPLPNSAFAGPGAHTCGGFLHRLTERRTQRRWYELWR